jgi:C1A family cysteine protease
MFEFMQQKQGATPFMPSRLFIYYNERELEGTIPYDAGAYIRDGMKVINTLGVCTEITWPYKVSDFAVKPSSPSYTEGLLNQSLQYMRVNRTLTDLQKCLVDGYPFVFGFSVYDSFYNAGNTGTVTMPKPTEKLLGGHAVMAVGFDVKTKMFLVRNSWGDDWGLKGYFWMPFEYLTNTNLSDDFWTLRKVEV